MTRPFHLVVYSDATERGGAEVILAMLLGALPEPVRVTLVGVDPAVVRWLADHRPGTDTRIVERIRDKSDLAGLWRHRRLFRSLRPDIVHFNLSMMSSCQWALLAAVSIPGARVVAVENSPMGVWSELSRRLKRLTSRRLAAHLAVGERTARLIERDGGLPAGSVETMYHGVADVRRDLTREPHDGPVIVNVARHDPVKGVDVLVRAMALLDPSVKLVQIGTGPETAALVALRDELALGDRVEFRELPDDERAADHLAAFDLFVLPSHLEGFPVTIMEAMLAGLAVVVTDVGSVREAVVDGETGLIVAPGDPAALAAAIEELVADPGRRAAMGRAARAIAESRFTPERTVARYLDVYERVLDGRGRPDATRGA